MWRAKAPDPAQVRLLNQARQRYDLTPLVIHDSYLINLASDDSVLRARSIDALTGELERAILIGADYLVAHPGNYKNLTLEQGILNVAEGLAKGWLGVSGELRKQAKLAILLENTAGARNELGGDLSELATLRQRASPDVDIPIGYRPRYLAGPATFMEGISVHRKALPRHYAKRTSCWGWSMSP